MQQGTEANQQQKISLWRTDVVPGARHVFVVFVGALFSSVVIPYLAAGWQDHQKELDFKSALVGKISAASSTMIATIQTHQYNRNPNEIPDVPVEGSYAKILQQWTLQSGAIDAQIQPYFQQSTSSIWRTYDDLVINLYDLSLCTRQASVIQEHEGGFRNDMQTLAAKSGDVAGTNVLGTLGVGRWRGWAFVTSCQQMLVGTRYEHYWLELLDATEVGRDIVISTIVNSDIPAYSRCLVRICW